MNKERRRSRQFTELNDTELMARVRRRDEQAMTELYDRFVQLVRYICTKFMGAPDDVEDMCQTVFARAIKGSATFRGGPIVPWIARIAVNACINERKKRKRHNTFNVSNMTHDTAEDNDSHNRPPLVIDSKIDRDPDPASRAQSREEYRMLWREIDGLDPDAREIIVMRYFHNASYRELAEALGIPIGTVMSRLFYARHDLMNSLDGLRRARRGEDVRQAGTCS